MKECSSLTRFVGVKIALMCDICIHKNMMAWALCVWENKNNHKISNKSAKRFWARGCEDMIMELKEEGCGACCGAF
jgi:hypothetical protein